MSVSRFSQSSLQNGFEKFNTIWDGRSAVGSMEAISSVTLSGSQTNVEFNNIPQTYSHLQIRFMARTSTAGTAQDELQLQLGNNLIDGGNNYAYHFIYGTGTTSIASNGVSQSYIRSGFLPRASATASCFGIGTIDILDYTSTNKQKTIRSICGADLNDTNGLAALCSGIWFPASPVGINIIRLKPETTSTFPVNSIFSLYGIR